MKNTNRMKKECSKEEFEKFLNSYPGKVDRELNRIGELMVYYDFSLEDDPNKCIIAQWRNDDRGTPVDRYWIWETV